MGWNAEALPDMDWSDLDGDARQAVLNEFQRREKERRPRRRMSNNVPFSNESERGVISGILHDPNERMDVVHEQVPEGAFYHAANGAAFEVLQDMRRAGLPIDPVTFTNRARELDKLKVIGGENAINDLYAHRPPGHHFMAYLRTLKEKRAARLVIEVCDRFREMAYTPGTDPAEMVDLFQKDALQISLERDERGPRHIREVLEVIDSQIDKRLEMLSQNQQIAGYELGLPRARPPDAGA